MPLASPKVATTRLSIPIGISGEEPANAQVGTLGYATDTDKVRVQTSTGWQDVGGGAGSITTIDSPDGSLVVTNPGGPVVSIEANQDPTTSPFVLKDLGANYTIKTGVGGGDRLFIEGGVSGDSRFTESQYLPLAGDVSGRLSTSVVNKITETSGPTSLTIGAINDFQLLQRVGATVVGTAYPPTTLAGDANGSMTANTVNAIHETSGPTQLTIGTISDGQTLVRSGATIIGSSSAGGRLPSQYWTPAVSPSTIDDPFLTGSSDMATRGWTCTNGAGTVFTRAGDCSFNTNGNATTVGNTYRSTLTANGMLIQCSQEIMFVKVLPVAFNAGSVTVAVDFFGSNRATTGGNTARFVLSQGTSPNYTSTRQLFVEYYNSLKNAITFTPPSTYTNINGTGTATPASNFHATHTIIDSSTTGPNANYRMWHIDPLTGGVLNRYDGSGFNAALWGCVALVVSCNIAEQSWWQFRGFRVTASGTFPML